LANFPFDSMQHSEPQRHTEAWSGQAFTVHSVSLSLYSTLI